MALRIIPLALAAACFVCAAAPLRAAQLIDEFDDGDTVLSADLEARPTLRPWLLHRGAARAAGGHRVTQLRLFDAEAASGGASAAPRVTVGGGVLNVTRPAGAPLIVSVGYGDGADSSIDLSAENAFRLEFEHLGMPLTVIAWVMMAPPDAPLQASLLLQSRSSVPAGGRTSVLLPFSGFDDGGLGLSEAGWGHVQRIDLVFASEGRGAPAGTFVLQRIAAVRLP